MIASLAALAAPLDEAQFRALLRGRALLHRPGGGGGNRYESLFGWPAFQDVIAKGGFAPEKIRVTLEERTLEPRAYQELGKVKAASVMALLERGASVLLYGLEDRVPALATLCADLAARLGEKVSASAVATTGAGGALKRHFDHVDVVVLQMEGSKRWKIHAPPVAAPVKAIPVQPPPDGAPVFDKVLEAGDFLFVPAGYWHHCENGPGRSLHISILFAPPTGYHAAEALFAQLGAEELFRTPLTRFADAQARSAHDAALKARLLEKIEEMALAQMAAAKTTAD